MKTCGIKGCAGEMARRGMCHAHYQQVNRAVRGEVRRTQPKQSPEERAWLKAYPNGIPTTQYAEALAMVKRLEVHVELEAPEEKQPNKQRQRQESVDAQVRLLLEGGPATLRELREATGLKEGWVLGALRRLGAIHHGTKPAYTPNGAMVSPAIVWALPSASKANGATQQQQVPA